ncbi:thioredoxin family protein [Patescibacteria group bacterium]|nr:thioredoxin family protein [Patescibacteria group bacterium]
MKVIKIGAVWCSGCLVMRPRWQEIEKENPWLKTEYYDFDQDQKKVGKYLVESENLPVFIFLDKQGKEFLRLHGEPSKADLVKIIMENKDK